MLAGVIGFFYHLHDLYQPDFYSIEISEAFAVIAGLYLLRGSDWARWLALAWMAFHVAISYDDTQKLIIHACIFVLIAWLLFRPGVRHYFRGTPA